MPITLFLISSLIILSITFHDISVSKSVVYRLLINEAISDENPFFLPGESISDSEIINEINKATIFYNFIDIKTEYNVNKLRAYTSKNNASINFSYFEKCDFARKIKGIVDSISNITNK